MIRVVHCKGLYKYSHWSPSMYGTGFTEEDHLPFEKSVVLDYGLQDHLLDYDQDKIEDVGDFLSLVGRVERELRDKGVDPVPDSLVICNVMTFGD